MFSKIMYKTFILINQQFSLMELSGLDLLCKKCIAIFGKFIYVMFLFEIRMYAKKCCNMYSRLSNVWSILLC